MELEERKSEVFNAVPTYFLDRVLYACDTGNIEYLAYLFNEEGLNVNRKYKDVWAKPGYDEAMEYIKLQKIELHQAYENKEISANDFFEHRFRLDREHRVLDRQFSGYCNYGSLLDAMIRYAIEAKQLDMTMCLLNIDGVDYQRCWQTFLVAMEYNIPFVLKKLLDSKLELHRYATQGYVGQKIINELAVNTSLEPEMKQEIHDYVQNNYDIKQYKKNKKQSKRSAV